MPRITSLLVLNLCLFLTVGCGTELDDPKPVAEATATPETNAPAEPEDVTCDAPGEICLSVNAPAGLSGTPDRLSVNFFSSLPPMGPPDIFGTELKSPDFSSGEPITIRSTSITKTGNYYAYIVLYMPDGGEWMPESGIDYIGSSAEPLNLTGDQITIETPFDLTIAE